MPILDEDLHFYRPILPDCMGHRVLTKWPMCCVDKNPQLLQNVWRISSWNILHLFTVFSEYIGRNRTGSVLSPVACWYKGLQRPVASSIISAYSDSKEGTALEHIGISGDLPQWTQDVPLVQKPVSTSCETDRGLPRLSDNFQDWLSTGRIIEKLLALTCHCFFPRHLATRNHTFDLTQKLPASQRTFPPCLKNLIDENPAKVFTLDVAFLYKIGNQSMKAMHTEHEQNMGVSKNRCTPKSSIFNRVWNHYKPSILGVFPLFLETPIWQHII